VNIGLKRTIPAVRLIY